MTSPARKPAAKKAPAAKKTTRSSTVARQPSREKVAAKSGEKKHPKPILVRDSFTMPDNEYALLAKTKKTCLKAGFEIKKSELIRIGIALAHNLSAARLKKAQQALQPVKTGRPKKHK